MTNILYLPTCLPHTVLPVGLINSGSRERGTGMEIAIPLLVPLPTLHITNTLLQIERLHRFSITVMRHPPPAVVVRKVHRHQA